MSLPELNQRDGIRARRWDAVILGSGLTALITAARLGMAGKRVLVVEEEAASRSFAGLREPFFLAGSRDGGLVDACMRDLTLSLMDRRRIEPEELSYQLLGDDLRLDLGTSALSAQELVAWGVCKPDSANLLVRSLRDASEAERKAMLSSPVVRVGRRMGRSKAAGEGSHRRGLPAEAASPEPGLAPILAAQVRALSNLAQAPPPPESQARLLGSALAGGAGFPGGPPWLHEILRRRVEAVFGEFRTLSRGFRIVSAMNQPAIAVDGSSEVWTGRMLVIACAPTAVASMLKPDEIPDFLPVDRTTRERLSVHVRAPRKALPEGIAKRAIMLDPDARGMDAGSPITLSIFERADDPKSVDIVLKSIRGKNEEPAEREQVMIDQLLRLMPFHGDRFQRVAITRPRWDSEDLLEDPTNGACWPGEVDLRATAKLPVYLLDRSWVAGLGLEGDLLLGLKAGEALQAELR
jgi:hypothetical protein